MGRREEWVGKDGIELIDLLWERYNQILAQKPRDLRETSEIRVNFHALAQLASLALNTMSSIPGYTTADLLHGESWLERLRKEMTWTEGLERCLRPFPLLGIPEVGKVLECAYAGSALAMQLGATSLDEPSSKDFFQVLFRGLPPFAVFAWAANWMDALLDDLAQSELWIARVGASSMDARSLTLTALDAISGLIVAGSRLHLRQHKEARADGDDTHLTLRLLFALIAANEKALAALPPLQKV